MRLPVAHLRWNSRSLRVVLFGFLVVNLILAGTSRTAEPTPSPRRCVPAQGLVAYLEYEGLDAHADAWKASAAHGILVDGHAGSMLSELARQLLDLLFQEDPGWKANGADILKIHDHLMHRGFVIAVHLAEDGALTTTIVLRDVGSRPVRDRLDHFVKAALGKKEAEKLHTVRIRGRDVFQLEDGPETRASVEPNVPVPVAPLAPPDPPEAMPPTTVQTTPMASVVSWWFEGNDLVYLDSPAADSKARTDPAARKKLDPANNRYRSIVFDTIEGKLPDVTTSAAYVSAIADDKVIKEFEPNGLLLLDPGKGEPLLSRFGALFGDAQALSLPPGKYISPADAPPQLALSGSALVELPDFPDDFFEPAPGKVKAKGPDLVALLGIDGLKRVVVRWGFQGKAILTVVRIEAPSPRKGLIACLDQPAFPRSRLPLIPRGTREFVVGSFDGFGSYARFKSLVKAIEPDLAKEIPSLEHGICEAIGLRSPETLRHVGPSWSVFRLPSLDGNALASAEPDPTEYAFVAAIDSPEAIGKMLDSIADKVNQQLAEPQKGEGPDQGKKVADPPVLALVRLGAPDRGYQLTSPARLVPWLNDGLKPTILVGKSIVALASNLERAREALSAEMPAGDRWSPDGELQKALGCLPDKLTFVAVGDPRVSAWPTVLEQLPGEVQLLVAMLGGGNQDQAPDGSGLLAALGIPRPGGFRVRIDPAKIPKADQVRQRLFPSILAATIDDRGFSLINREAFPLACLGGKASLKSTGTWTSGKGFLQDVKLKLDLLGLRP